MKALVSENPGGPETLRFIDMQAPSAGEGEVLIEVEACAINYPDVLIIQDLYQVKPRRPFVPGCEIAGVIGAIGHGVEDWKIGDHVIATVDRGGLAERCVAKIEDCFRLPEDRSFPQAAALLLTYATTIHALVDRGRLAKGDVLLILGAAGGVGIAAIEIGRALGATVVAAVSSPEKAEAARRAGAHRTIIYPRPPFDADGARALASRFKEAVGDGGAQVIYDPVGGDYVQPALRSIGWGGRYLVVGFPAGIHRLPLNLPLLKGCDVCGVWWGEFARRDPMANRRHVDTLMQWWREGRINPLVSRCWPLEAGHEAIAMMADRQAIGKLVVTMRAPR